MKNFSLLRLYAIFIIIIFSCACERNASTETGEIEVSVQKAGKLELKLKKDSPRTIYIDVRDSKDHTTLTPEYLPAMLTEDNFEVVDNPSKAAYILHISLLEEGRTDPQKLNGLLDSGYDGKSGFSGDGLSAWLADALLVQRRVPAAKRESHTRLQNISARNALGNSQMRIAISTSAMLDGREAYKKVFAKTLAQAIREALTGKKHMASDSAEKGKQEEEK